MRAKNRRSKFRAKVTSLLLGAVTSKHAWVTCVGLRSAVGSDARHGSHVHVAWVRSTAGC